MATATEDVQVMQAGNEYYLRRAMVKAVELGPYAFPVRVRARAYTTHNQGGDESTASMKLFYDGNMVGEHSDRHFNTANLQVRYNLVIDSGNTADLRIESTNDRATEVDYGFELWLSLAPV